MLGARSAAPETYHQDRRGCEHRATTQTALRSSFSTACEMQTGMTPRFPFCIARNITHHPFRSFEFIVSRTFRVLNNRIVGMYCLFLKMMNLCGDPLPVVKRGYIAIHILSPVLLTKYTEFTPGAATHVHAAVHLCTHRWVERPHPRAEAHRPTDPALRAVRGPGATPAGGRRGVGP